MSPVCCIIPIQAIALGVCRVYNMSQTQDNLVCKITCVVDYSHYYDVFFVVHNNKQE